MRMIRDLTLLKINHPAMVGIAVHLLNSCFQVRNGADVMVMTDQTGSSPGCSSEYASQHGSCVITFILCEMIPMSTYDHHWQSADKAVHHDDFIILII